MTFYTTLSSGKFSRIKYKTNRFLSGKINKTSMIFKHNLERLNKKEACLMYPKRSIYRACGNAFKQRIQCRHIASVLKVGGGADLPKILSSRIKKVNANLQNPYP